MKGRASTYTIVSEIEGMEDTLTDTPLYKGAFDEDQLDLELEEWCMAQYEGS
jgi:hypothetical protein